MRTRQAAGTLINVALRPLGLELRRSVSWRGYIDTNETVAAAKAQGLSVEAYTETAWNQRGHTARVIERMRKAGCFSDCHRMCEIGPGTGRYMARSLDAAPAAICEYYEVDKEWASWLEQTYGPRIRRRLADGSSLNQTAERSCQLVMAHGVFVYRPMLTTFDYLKEASRVCGDGGFVVFDCFTEEEVAGKQLQRWLASRWRYAVVIPESTLLSYCSGLGLALRSDFKDSHFIDDSGEGRSRYFIFQKQSS
jgi:hypothetical protein